MTTTERKFERKLHQEKQKKLSDTQIALELKTIMFNDKGKFRFFNTLKFIFKVGAQMHILLKIDKLIQTDI